MAKNLIIGDIHGRYEKLMAVLERDHMIPAQIYFTVLEISQIVARMP